MKLIINNKNNDRIIEAKVKDEIYIGIYIYTKLYQIYIIQVFKIYIY
jgi:hypothetical protein